MKNFIKVKGKYKGIGDEREISINVLHICTIKQCYTYDNNTGPTFCVITLLNNDHIRVEGNIKNIESLIENCDK